MSQLLGVPVPSVDQIVVGAELVFILYPARAMARRLDTGMRQERNRIIKHHVKSGHEDRLTRCSKDECPNLQSSVWLPEQPDLQPEIEVDLL